MLNLAIFDYQKGKLITLNKSYLEELGYNEDWKDELNGEEGLEGCISCVLGFSLNQIHYMEYTKEDKF